MLAALPPLSSARPPVRLAPAPPRPRRAEKFKDETRKMVGIMVEMERNYITAEYFRTIQV